MKLRRRTLRRELSRIGAERHGLHPATPNTKPNYTMGFEDCKVVLDRGRNQPDGWVADIPAIAGCRVLIVATEEPFAELAEVFAIIEQEFREQQKQMPSGAVERASAQCSGDQKGASAFHS